MTKKVKEKIISWLHNSSDIKISIIAFIMAMAISSVFILFSGFSPIKVFAALYKGSFGSTKAIVQTLSQATPLIVTGLAYTVTIKAGLVNIGVEGQMYIGAMGAAIAGAYLNLPPLIHVPVAILTAMILGGLFAAIVAFLKIKFDSNEVITTIMFNFVAISFTSYLVNYPLKEAKGMIAQTDKILKSAELTRLFPKSQLTSAFIFAIIAVILVHIMFKRTSIGYEIRAVGLNIKGAETAGIKVKRIFLVTLFLSGAIAGLAGAGQILGVQKKFIDHFSPGYGFDGIAIAALAANSPIGVIFSGILFGALKAGALMLNRTAKVPTDIVNVIQGLVIIFVAAPLLVKQIAKPFKITKSSKKEEA